MTEPSLAALLARLESVVEKQADLAKRLDNLADTLSRLYVPRGEYDANRKADDRRFGELEQDNKDSAAFKRQVAAGFIVGFLLVLLNGLAIVNNMLAR